MDSISLIVSALSSAAGAAVQGVAQGISQGSTQEAYHDLKALIKRKFAGEPKAQMVLEEHEQDPQTYEAPLKKKLAEAGADKDEEIIKAAQDLLKQLKPEEVSTGESYQLNVGRDFTGVGRDVNTGGGDANLDFSKKN